MINKIQAIALAKQIFRTVLLPLLLIVPALTLFHYLLVALWVYLNYSTLELNTIIGIALFAGAFASTTFFLWGFRRFILKSYRVIHQEVILDLVGTFCEEQAPLVLNSKIKTDFDNLPELLEKWRSLVYEKTEVLPTYLKQVVHFSIRRFKFTAFIDELSHFRGKDEEELTDMLFHLMDKGLIHVSEKAVSPSIRFLIPINTIIFICIWFI